MTGLKQLGVYSQALLVRSRQAEKCGLRNGAERKARCRGRMKTNCHCRGTVCVIRWCRLTGQSCSISHREGLDVHKRVVQVGSCTRKENTFESQEQMEW